MTAILWDGSGTPTIGATASVGALPVGIDVLGSRVVSTGFDDDTYSITEFDGAGALVGTTSTAVPVGCSQPGHAMFLGSTNDAVVVSCFGSDSIAYIPEAF